MNNGTFPRWANIALGIWLILSSFLWAHSEAQFANAWIVGAGAAVVAAIAMTKREQARYVNAALAVWLFASAWVLPTVADATFWNHLIVSVLMLVASLTPTAHSASHGHHGPASAGVRR